MLRTRTQTFRTLAVLFLVVAGLLLVISSAFALNAFLKDWEAAYPHSASSDANCALCHGTSNGNLNSYGKEICDAFGGTIPADITDALRAIEGVDSDSNGDSNLAEISADAQPGWTAGDTNEIFVADSSTGCQSTGVIISPPSGVPLPYDPPVEGEPVAIPGGPYSGNVNVPLAFDGSGSYDSDGGNIVSYLWNFGDNTTGTGMVVDHTYLSAGTFVVTLTVIDNDGNENTATTTATISGEAVLDLDIDSFSTASSIRLGKSVDIKLSVDNPGPILGQAIATVIGVQDGVEVYSWSLNVYDKPGGKTTGFSFPSYTPLNAGTISWSVTIYDVDPDIDQASATTVVK